MSGWSSVSRFRAFRWGLGAVVVLTLCPVFSSADSGALSQDEKWWVQRFGAILSKAVVNIYENRKERCDGCENMQAGLHDPRDPECQKKYEDFFKDDVIDFQMLFGYADNYEQPTRLMDSQNKTARNQRYLQDKFMAIAFIERITKPCSAGLMLCGFKQADDDGELFTRTMIGPDGKEKVVKLTVAYSSETSSDLVNRTSGWKAQEARTERLKKYLYDGLKEGKEFTAVVSHARKGWGPAFHPAVLMPAGSKFGQKEDPCPPGFSNDGYSNIYEPSSPQPNTNYVYNYRCYETKVGSLKEVYKSIIASSPDKRPNIVGLFGCNTGELFGPYVDLSSLGKTAFMGTTGVYATFDSNLFAATMAMDSLLSMRCDREFCSRLNRYPELFLNKPGQKKTTPIDFSWFPNCSSVR